MTDFEIDVLDAGRAVALRGRLDVRHTPAARAVLRGAVDDGSGELVLDLAALEIWDAAGLGVLVGLSRRARRTGRPLALVGVRPRELRLLRVARLTSACRVVPAGRVIPGAPMANGAYPAG